MHSKGRNVVGIDPAHPGTLLLYFLELFEQIHVLRSEQRSISPHP